MHINLSGVTPATWTRIITLLVVLINQIAISIFVTQLLPFTDAEIYEGISVALTVLASVVAGWKNNSITEEAQIADDILKSSK